VLEPPTTADQERMRAFGHEHNMSLCLQSKGPDTITPLDGEPEIIPTYALPDLNLEFKFKPAMFTQVNYEINQQMINRVLETLNLDENDTVLDLFCGLGNFTLPMARFAGRVVGIEGDQPLVNHAKENARHNNISNVEFYAADLRISAISPGLTVNITKSCWTLPEPEHPRFCSILKNGSLSKLFMCPAIPPLLPAMQVSWLMNWAINWLKPG
jgi:SAM-dependent methyltransferase